MVRSAAWAFGILLLSYVISHVAAATGLTWLVPLAFLAFLPFLPMFLVVLVLMGGPHEANGEPLIMVYTGLLAFAVWWAVLYGLTRRSKMLPPTGGPTVDSARRNGERTE